MGCRAYVDTQGTPLAGSTLLHLCVDYDELDMARWLLDRGMPVDAKAAVNARGFGGHSALFNAVVCYANFWGNYRGESVDSPFARLLLERGADPNLRVSMRKRFEDGEVQECPAVTPTGWGRVFRDRILVSEPAMHVIAERGGTES